jgi:hypothetical protein
VLAFGDGAVLSHRSAAALWGIARPTEVIEVTVSGTAGRAERRGINVHRSRTLLSSDCTRRNGIPVTKPSRTLEDLRRVASDKEFAAAVRQAEFLRLPIGTGSRLTGRAPSLRLGCSASAAGIGFRNRW